MSAGDEDNFLSRWSQRKREAARQPPPAEAPKTEPSAADEEPFDLSLLPKLDELTPESDISLFLRKGVPAALKNAALKRVWAMDPAIRDRVGDALDYAWDWNAPGGVPGGGELPADFDARSMVAKIFGENPADENVMKDAAPQQVALSQDPAAPEAASVSDEKPRQTRDGASGSETSEDGGRHVAPQRPRRHGGALPG